MTALTLTGLAANDQHWPILADLIRSEQVPADRMAEIAKDYPAFWDWLQGARS